MLNAQICGDLLQCKTIGVVAQPCCGGTHALSHVRQATLKKAEYDDNFLFYAIWCPLERQ